MQKNHTVSLEQPKLTGRLINLMSVAGGVAVANIYYLQPLLSQMAEACHITQSAAGFVATLTQAGFALGLLLLLPLADIVEKRQLILTVLICAGASLALLYFASDPVLISAASFAIGFTSITPQLLIPLGAQLANPRDRGTVIGRIMSGLLVGILLSRTASGFIGKNYGWQAIYLIAAIMMIGLAIILRFSLPKCPSPSKIKYHEALRSIPLLILRFAPLREASVVGAMVFCAFSAFWTALTFLLQGSYYHLGTDAVGLFGIIGITGALFSPAAGKISDKKGARFTAVSNIIIIITAFAVLGLFKFSLWGLIIGAILLDLGVQCCNVGNQAQIHQLSKTMRSRVTAIYMVSFFGGGALGSYLGAWSFQHYGWTGVCLLGAATQCIALCSFLYSRRSAA